MGSSMRGAISDLSYGLYHWRTWWAMGVQDIGLRYRRSFLGPFWISASLVALVLTLGYLYSEILQTPLRDFISFLACGYLAWLLISSLVNEGANSAMEHAALIRSTGIRVTMIAGRVALRNGIIFLHNLVAVIIILAFFGHEFSPAVPLALVGAAVILFAGYCCSVLLGPLSARFRDVPQILASVLQVMFFLTPIIWMPSAVSHRPAFVQSNPFYHLIELVRAPMLGHLPTALNWTVSFGVCLLLALAAIASLAIARRRVVLWL